MLTSHKPRKCHFFVDTTSKTIPEEILSVTGVDARRLIKGSKFQISVSLGLVKGCTGRNIEILIIVFLL